MTGCEAKPLSIELPKPRRPHVLREYTASPPHVYIETPPEYYERTPQVFHGFIPLGTGTPIPTIGGQNTDSTSVDYFSLTKKESVLSSYAVPYEPHGFIPLYSVAVVEKKDEPKEYFSHPLNEAPQEADEESQSVAVVEKARTSDTLTPWPYNDHTDLMHQTGSPVHERDVTPTPPGGHESILFDASRKGRANSNINAYPMEDTLDKLEQNNQIFDTCAQRLERAVLEVGSPNRTSVINDNQVKHTSSSSSIVSANTESVYSNDNDTKQESAEAESRIELVEEDAGWLQLVEATSLPESHISNGKDSGNDGELESEYHTALLDQASDDRNFKGTNVESEQMTPTPAMQTISNLEYRPKRTSSPGPDTPMPTSLSPPEQSIPRRSRLPPPPPDLTIYQYALHASPRTLASLLVGPKLDIVNDTTHGVFVSSVPQRMLEYFCGREVIQRLSSTSPTSPSPPQNTLSIPPSSASKEALARIIRFTTRCCKPKSHASSGDIRIPQGATYLQDGIDTFRACLFLNLHADAERLSRHIISTLTFGDDTIDQIWNGYGGSMRNSAFGDAVVWYILKETQGEDHGVKEELLGMLEYEEFKELKQRVRNEVKLRMWRGETRGEYLERWGRERRRKEKKRARLEREEREMRRRIEGIKRGNREERERRGKEEVVSVGMGHGSDDEDWSSARSHVRNSPDSVLSLGREKTLPTPPSDADSGARVEMMTSLPDLRSHTRKATSMTPTDQASRQNLAIASSSLCVQQGRPSDAWESPRSAPILRKKSSLFKRFLKKAFED